MGRRSKLAPQLTSDSENGEAFTDGDFEDSDEDTLQHSDDVKSSQIPINEATNSEHKSEQTNGDKVNRVSDDHNNNNENGHKSFVDGHSTAVNGRKNAFVESTSSVEDVDTRRNSHEEYNPSIVGILGNQHSHVSYRVHFAKAIVI